MGKNYDLIATVDIDIATPIVDNTSFDNLLIMGPPPKGGLKTPAYVGVYGNLTEVEDAGFVSTGEGADPVGVAARVAFAQSPTPTQVYIAVSNEEISGTENAEGESVKMIINPGLFAQGNGSRMKAAE